MTNPTRVLRGRSLPVLPSRADLAGLRRWNVAAFLLHLASGVALVVLGNDLAFAVNASPSQGQPGAATSWPVEQLFTVSVTWAAASFAFVSAVAHLLAATLARGRYESDLLRGYNQLRWIEYSISSTIMILVIAQLTDIFDIAALLGLAGCNVAMILFGWSMDLHNRDRRGIKDEGPAWWSFIFGCIPGLVPWAAIVTYIVLAGDGVPGFVYGIFVSLFVFFNCFAAVMVLEYAGLGPFQRVAFVERAYIVLSFTAKVALTWQVGANVLL